MKKFENQRVGVFVDVQNMYYSARNFYGARANFGKILDRAVENRSLIRAIAYVVRAEAPEEAKFFEALEGQGFELKMKDLQVFSGGTKKGDWDVGLAVDAISTAPKLDVVVLATGDGDFAPLVQYLQFLGIKVELLAFGDTVSAKLVEQVDQFYDLAKEKGSFLIRSARSEATRPRRS